MTLFTASTLIANILPWPTKTYRAMDRDVLVVRDTQHNFDVEIPFYKLDTIPNASREIAESLLHYRLLIDAWHGRYLIVWS